MKVELGNVVYDDFRFGDSSISLIDKAKVVGIVAITFVMMSVLVLLFPLLGLVGLGAEIFDRVKAFRDCK